MVECPIECVDRDLICQSPPDWLEKHASFTLTLVGLVGGGLGVLLTYFLKSRCKNISLGWNCLSCEREVPELKPDELQVS